MKQLRVMCGFVLALAVVAGVTFKTTEAAAAGFNESLEQTSNGIPVGWQRNATGVNTASWALVRYAHSGKVAQKITVSSHASGQLALRSAASATTGGQAVQPGVALDLSSWYRTDAIARVVAYTRTATGPWVPWFSGPVLARATAWTKTVARTPAVPVEAVAVSFGVAISSVGFLVTDDYAINAVSPLGSGALLEDHFNRPDGLITNEYAWWNPTDPTRVTDLVWSMTSGSLFASGGVGTTGKIDDTNPDATSFNGTNSAVFRMISARSDLSNVTVDMKLRNDGLYTTASTPAVAWDGVHVILRYESETSLYYASVNRRDNTVAIKKKVSGGTSNGGTYYTLAAGTWPVPTGVWQNVVADVYDQPDGSVAITLKVNGTLVVSAVDSGVGGPVIAKGRVGVRGDNCRFSLDDIVVTAR